MTQQHRTTKIITLCADDFSLNEAISQGIIQLAASGRISAISCLTNTALWEQHAAWLTPYQDTLDIGLHFNLTEGRPLGNTTSYHSLAALIIKAHGHWINAAAVEAELLLQLQAFQQQLQRLPDFIDGHQHVHHLPVVRRALLKVYEEHLRPHGSYVRVSIQQGGGLKPKMIAATGARRLRQQLIKHQIPYNKTFAGSYPFAHAIHYPDYFRGFLAAIGENGLIMCHPALPQIATDDIIANARASEWHYFNSATFQADCERYHVTLGRLKV